MGAYDRTRSDLFELCWRIEGFDEPEVGVWLFRRSCPLEEIEANLRRAVQEFVKTEAGILVATNNYAFNWGDAVDHIPEEWWNRYGLSFPEQRSVGFRIQVDHDESFVEHLGRGKGRKR